MKPSIALSWFSQQLQIASFIILHVYHYRHRVLKFTLGNADEMVKSLDIFTPVHLCFAACCPYNGAFQYLPTRNCSVLQNCIFLFSGNYHLQTSHVAPCRWMHAFCIFYGMPFIHLSSPVEGIHVFLGGMRGTMGIYAAVYLAPNIHHLSVIILHHLWVSWFGQETAA